MPEEFFQNALHSQGVAGFGRKSLIFKRISSEFHVGSGTVQFNSHLFLRWGLVFFKSRLQNDVRRFGCGLAGLFSQQNLLNLIKRCSNQHAEIFMDETNMRRLESVFTNRITTS